MIKKIWHYRGVRFIAVGITNTIIDFAVLNVLVFGFSLNKIIANSISVSVAMIISYILNYRIVFRQDSKNHAKKFLLFVLITAFGLFVLQNLTIYLFVHVITFPAIIATNIFNWLGFDSLSRDFITLNLAKLLATAVSMIWNYFMYKKFVFTKSETETNAKSEVNN
jgi:putative flippase GtrA